ncbi:hypothetical protein DXG01_003611 [Tephrocybe rancida]|nr:hypothetical protein DXG01_003611 [Tephrocybe rancida]
MLAGRISDIYQPKPVFIAGFFLIGVLGIGAGFVHNIIGLIVLRAFQGIGAAMTIPSATAMLTGAFTTPLARGIALTFFASVGTLGLCLGFVLGGIIVQFATWRWVFWVVPIITVPLSVASMFIIPSGKHAAEIKTNKKLDVPGVVAFTGSIILLIFALSQAPIVGWGTARVLAPLVVAVTMMVGFFLWQTRLHDEHALIPPKTWFIPNFFVLTLVSFCTQIYLTGPILVLSEYWPAAYNWGALTIGLHVDRYWSYTFPSFILITMGSSAAYMISNVGIVTSVPPDAVGVAAAIFNASQQVGGAINVAIISTVLVQVQNRHPYPSYKGPSSAMWFIVALGLLQVVVVALFFKPQKKAAVPPADDAVERK